MYEGKKIFVLGMGRSGVAVSKLLNKKNHILLTDMKWLLRRKNSAFQLFMKWK